MLRLGRKKPRLLVLDDDPSMQRLIATLLRRNGYAVDVVSAGHDAIAKIEGTTYDALLLDVMTPTEGGMTVIRHLREGKPEMLKRVLLVTASPDAGLRSVENDIYAVVKKPFSPEELIETISRLLE